MLHVLPWQKIPQGYKGAGLPFQINFITLTLSSQQIHDDAEIKKMCFQPFLDILRKTYDVKYYLWRAESQENGRIHFHLCTEKFIPWRWLRTYWNRYQEKLGYVSRWEKRTGKNDPNSTDVHSIWKCKNVAGYLSKYCGKNSKGHLYTALQNNGNGFHACYNPSNAMEIIQGKKCKTKAQEKKRIKYFRTIGGKQWGVSENVSKLCNASVEINMELSMELDYLRRHYPEKVIEGDYVTLYLMNYKELRKLGNLDLTYIIDKHTKQSIKICR